MQNLRNKATGVADSYFKVLRWATLVSSACLMIMLLYITADVSGRYLAQKSLPASFELPETIMIFIIFLALAYVQARGGHLRLEFLSQRLNPRGQALLHILSLLIGLLIFSIITWQGYLWTVEAWVKHEYMQGVWKFPYFPSRLIYTIGAFLFCIQYILDITRHIGQLLGIAQAGEQQ